MDAARPDSESSTSPVPVKRVSVWGQLFPYLVGALLLGFVWWTVDLSTLWATLSKVNYVLYGGAMFVFVVVILLLDGIGTHAIFSKNLGDVAVKDIIVLRGASYLPSVLNYHLGQAWLTWFVARLHKIPMSRVFGATLMTYETMFGSLFLLAAGAYFISPSTTPWLLPVLVAVAVAAVAFLIVIAVRPERLTHNPTARLLLDAGIGGHFRALAFRLPHIIVLFFAVWVPYEMFDIHLTLSEALTVVPPILIVGALPLTPQGVGTRDIVAIQLLTPFGPGTPEESAAVIAAATITWSVCITVCQCVVSPFLMKRAQDLLRVASLMEKEAV